MDSWIACGVDTMAIIPLCADFNSALGGPSRGVGISTWVMRRLHDGRRETHSRYSHPHGTPSELSLSREGA